MPHLYTQGNRRRPATAYSSRKKLKSIHPNAHAVQCTVLYKHVYVHCSLYSEIPDALQSVCLHYSNRFLSADDGEHGCRGNFQLTGSQKNVSNEHATHRKKRKTSLNWHSEKREFTITENIRRFQLNGIQKSANIPPLKVEDYI